MPRVTSLHMRIAEESKNLRIFHHLDGLLAHTSEQIIQKEKVSERIGELHTASAIAHFAIENMISSYRNLERPVTCNSRIQMIDDLIAYLKNEKKLLRKEANHA